MFGSKSKAVSLGSFDKWTTLVFNWCRSLSFTHTSGRLWIKKQVNNEIALILNLLYHRTSHYPDFSASVTEPQKLTSFSEAKEIAMRCRVPAKKREWNFRHEFGNELGILVAKLYPNLKTHYKTLLCLLVHWVSHTWAWLDG